MSEKRRSPKFWALAAVSVLAFSVSFLAFDRVLFTAVRASARHYYASLGQDDYKFRASFGKGDGDLLIFGTSRTYCGLAPYILSNQLKKRVILEAESGKSPKYFFSFYRRHRKSFPLPKLVLYGLDYFMFDRRSSPAQLARLGQNIKLEAMNLVLAADNRSSLLSRISWLYRKKPDLENYLVDLLRLERESALEGESENAPDKTPGQKQAGGGDVSAGGADRAVRPKTWPTFKYKPFPGVEGIYLEQLLAVLEHEDVPVFLLLIPDYVGTNETNIEQDKFKADVQTLAARHRRVFVLDFNRPGRFNLNDPQLFVDGGWGGANCHLSIPGKVIFTRRVVQAIKQALKGEEKTKTPEGKRAR